MKKINVLWLVVIVIITTLTGCTSAALFSTEEQVVWSLVVCLACFYLYIYSKNKQWRHVIGLGIVITILLIITWVCTYWIAALLLTLLPVSLIAIVMYQQKHLRIIKPVAEAFPGKELTPLSKIPKGFFVIYPDSLTTYILVLNYGDTMHNAKAMIRLLSKSFTEKEWKSKKVIVEYVGITNLPITSTCYIASTAEVMSLKGDPKYKIALKNELTDMQRISGMDENKV